MNTLVTPTITCVYGIPRHRTPREIAPSRAKGASTNQEDFVGLYLSWPTGAFLTRNTALVCAWQDNQVHGTSTTKSEQGLCMLVCLSGPSHILLDFPYLPLQSLLLPSRLIHMHDSTVSNTCSRTSQLTVFSGRKHGIGRPTAFHIIHYPAHQAE
jgi:hypothetical protein